MNAPPFWAKTQLTAEEMKELYLSDVEAESFKEQFRQHIGKCILSDSVRAWIEKGKPRLTDVSMASRCCLLKQIVVS